MDLSEPLENYLKEIYEQIEEKGIAKVTDLIIAFNVSPGTVSKEVSRMEKLGLITRTRKGIRLTDDGMLIAERLVRAHRLSERLLTDLLHIDWIRAHQIAHRLEHVWSSDMLDVIDKALGYPSTCPHGHPIGNRTDSQGFKLSQVKEGVYIVKMIIREEEWVLRRVAELRLFPGTEIHLSKRNSAEVKVLINNEERGVEKAIADNVLVIPKNSR
ncbi:DtxR family transcriptional regulator [Sulfolobales archaeon HS-7]|nr:DtxR family transcriptional regulator [Sulfolobales archaeon HS-7]